MKKAKKLSHGERMEIEYLLGKEYSIRTIARMLNRSPNTISKEVDRNRMKRTGVYVADKAEHKAYVRKHYAHYYGKKIDDDDALRAYIVEGLKKEWNPDEIAGRMKQEHTPFYASKDTIYHWLYHSSYGIRYCRYLPSRRYRPKRRKHKKTKKEMIPNRISIDKRSIGAHNRSRGGHWEEDSMVSPRHASIKAVATMQERKTRLVHARKVDNLKPDTNNAAIMDMMQNRKVLSITFDNGIENKKHAHLPFKTFFCDPYCSWQKGGIEHANKMIRKYFPKGVDWKDISQTELSHAVHIINNKPRKCLGYRTAYEMAIKYGIMKKEDLPA